MKYFESKMTDEQRLDIIRRILAADDVKHGHKVVMCAIILHLVKYEKERFDIVFSHLAVKCGMSRKAVSKAVEELCYLGYLEFLRERVAPHGRTREYRLGIIDFDEDDKAIEQRMAWKLSSQEMMQAIDRFHSWAMLKCLNLCNGSDRHQDGCPVKELRLEVRPDKPFMWRE